MVRPADWRQNPRAYGYQPYSWRDIAMQQGYYDPAARTNQPWNPTSGEPPPDVAGAEDTSRLPYWMQAAQRHGVTNVWLTPEQREQIGQGANINPFGVGAPNQYAGDNALQRYMADNPDYAERIQQDPMFSELYNPDGSPRYESGQQYSGRSIPPGYRWSDAQGNPLQAPQTAPMATHLHQTVQRARAFADMMRQGLQKFQAQNAARMGYTLE